MAASGTFDNPAGLAFCLCAALPFHAFGAKVPGKALVPFCPCRMCFGHLDSHIMHRFPYRMDMFGIVCRPCGCKNSGKDQSYDETDDFGGVGCWSGLGHFGGQDGFHQRTPFHIGTFMGTGAGTAFCRIWPRRFSAGYICPGKTDYFKAHADSGHKWLANEVYHPLNGSVWVWIEFGLPGRIIVIRGLWLWLCRLFRRRDIFPHVVSLCALRVVLPVFLSIEISVGFGI